MSDPVYCYPPDYIVLKNKLDLRDAAQLDYVEREFVTQRTVQGIPSGDFDLTHLRAIHRHLFQDIYDWAGDVRTVEIAKGGSQFQFRRYIATGMADVHRRLVAADYLRRLAPTDFAARAGEIIGDVNYIHPFREGNGRTQMLYLEQLAAPGRPSARSAVNRAGGVDGGLHRGAARAIRPARNLHPQGAARALRAGRLRIGMLAPCALRP